MNEHIKGLVERVEEAIANDGKNVFIFEKEMLDLFTYCYPLGVFRDTACQKFTTFYGRPLVRIDGGYKLFIKCEYCGTREFPNSLGWCSKCGGWV
jgi:hypothetical protein